MLKHKRKCHIWPLIIYWGVLDRDNARWVVLDKLDPSPTLFCTHIAHIVQKKMTRWGKDNRWKCWCSSQSWIPHFFSVGLFDYSSAGGGGGFLIAFKITTSPFDDANVGNRGRINHRAPSSFSAIQKGNRAQWDMGEDTHTDIVLFLIFFMFKITFLSSSLSHSLHTCTSHPLHRESNMLKFIPPLALKISLVCTQTNTVNMYDVAFVSTSATVVMRLC